MSDRTYRLDWIEGERLHRLTGLSLAEAFRLWVRKMAIGCPTVRMERDLEPRRFHSVQGPSFWDYSLSEVRADA
jgi:hypothetical protein